MFDRLRRLRFDGATVIVFCFVFLVCAYFFGSGSWNQNARLDAIYSFVEPGPDQHTFRINRFLWNPQRASNTGDWALYAGNYFANKAPGTILLGVLAYLPLHWFETALLGLDPSMPDLEILNAYAINLVVSVLFAAIGAAAMLKLFCALGVERSWALALALIAFLATAVFPYSTQLWGTSTTVAFLVLGYLAILRRTPAGAALAGFCLGMAVVVDYLAAIYVGLGGLAVLAYHARDAKTLATSAINFAAGGVVPALLLGAYHLYCFDDPFVTASSLSAKVFVDEQRLLGFFALPTGRALWQLSFGLERGVFTQMPVLLLAFPGFALWFRRDRRDPLLWLCLASFAVPLCVVSSFNGWHGGATIAARYLIPALPWLVVPLKELGTARAARVSIAALSTVSAFNMLAIAATNPLGGESRNPLYGWAYQHFFAFDLAPFGLPTRLQAIHPNWPQIAPYTCFNWGEILGFQGRASMLPFALLVASFAGALAWTRMRSSAP